MATAPLVDWPMPPDRTVEPATEIQLYAIAIGASVPAILASATWWLHVEWIAAIAALGILIGPVLSVMEARRMLASSWSEGVLRAAFAAPLAAAALILGGVFVWWVVTISADSAPIGPEVVVGILGFGLWWRWSPWSAGCRSLCPRHLSSHGCCAGPPRWNRIAAASTSARWRRAPRSPEPSRSSQCRPAGDYSPGNGPADRHSPPRDRGGDRLRRAGRARPPA